MPDTDKPWLATLKKGRSYTLGTTDPIRFERGVDVPVTEAVKTRLSEKAVDHIDTGFEDDATGEALTEPRCKFDFRKAGTPAPTQTVSPRSRGSRRVHS